MRRDSSTKILLTYITRPSTKRLPRYYLYTGKGKGKVRCYNRPWTPRGGVQE